MALHPLAGKPPSADMLIDVAKLESDYYSVHPDAAVPAQKVSFGTSGHRGTSSNGTFNENHILAITQAICDFREAHDINGPLFMGMDSHALSTSAHRTALEVLAANDVSTFIARDGAFTPTPVISHAILSWNMDEAHPEADGIVITPSHNPPQDGGFKYNPPNGGPADSDITEWIQNRANELLAGGNSGVRRISYEEAASAPCTHPEDYITHYVEGLGGVIDLALIASSGLQIGVDPLGGASLGYWEPIADKYGLNLKVVNERVDPTFSFMTVDHDGKIRMDCSSPYAMAGLVGLKDQYDIAFGNDPDADRHGIVTRSCGLLNPNHYLAVAIEYLLQNRPSWNKAARVGKTLVSSGMIDRVLASLGRTAWEVPVGFKWFAPGLFDGTLCFGGEESAGASFLRMDGSVWSTDKDGLILGLLAAEIIAQTGKDPGEHYRSMTSRFGESYYIRIDAPASLEMKAQFRHLTPERVTAKDLAGEPIQSKLIRAPGNRAPIGGLKVTAPNGWFAARPSGTEAIYKLYAESFISQAHLQRILDDARQMVAGALST